MKRTNLRPLRLALVTLIAFTTLALGCKDDLDPGDDPPIEPTPSGGKVEHTEHDGYTETVVNATSSDEWVYFDFDAKREVTAPDTDDTWDIAFKRYIQMTNGGVSGDQDVGVAVLAEPFADVTAPPDAGAFLSDMADDDDTGDEPQSGFDADGGWYDYDPSTHELTPKERTYVVRTTEGAFVKLAFTGYYDGTGTSGMVRFLWATLPADAAASWSRSEVPGMTTGAELQGPAR